MKRISALVLGLLAIIWPAAPARAAWSSPGSGPATAKATTLLAPASLTASCGLLQASVKLDWPASASGFADSYEVARGASSGNYTVTYPPTTALTFTTPNLPLGTHHFAVRARKGSWTSGNSPDASKTIINLLLVATCT